MLLGLLLAALAVTVQGCQEDLESTAACPALCPSQNVAVRDTAFGVSLDTTLAGFPSVGTESFLLVASRGDTLEAAAVIRFDTLPARAVQALGDSAIAITSVDSAIVRVRLDLNGSTLPETITIDAYDVDTTAAEPDTAAVAALFRPDRLIGGVTLARAAVLDSVLVPVSNAVVLDRITSRRRLRVGLRVRGSGGAQLRIFSVEGATGTALGPRLTFRASADTALRAIPQSPVSVTPEDRVDVRSELRDYTVVLAGATGDVAGALGVGGLPARRSYLRFDIPPALLTQATIVRATLVLTQRPGSGADVRDTFYVYPHVVLAGSAITDIERAARLLGPKPGSFVNTVLSPLSADSLLVVPADSGTRAVELIRLVRQWQTRADTLAPRAIVLRSDREGTAPMAALFFSTDAAPELRPQLRVSYVPSVSFGLP